MKRFATFIILTLLVLSGCTTELPKTEDVNVEPASYTGNSLEQFCLVESNDDYTYNYIIKDKKGNVLISEKNISKEPKVEVVGENVISLSVQTGTGLATRWTIYCDIETGQKSDTYYYLLGQYENKAVKVELKDDKYSVTVHDIFDQTIVYSKTALEDVHTVEPIYEFKISDSGVADVTYLKGENFEKTILSIDLK